MEKSKHYLYFNLTDKNKINVKMSFSVTAYLLGYDTEELKERLNFLFGGHVDDEKNCIEFETYEQAVAADEWIKTLDVMSKLKNS